MITIIKRTDRCAEATIDDEIVIMRTDTGEFFDLSGTAAEIWRLIDGQRDRSALVAALTEAYCAPREQIEHEVDDFLKELKETGLVSLD